jgi:hypothetical protein
LPKEEGKEMGRYSVETKLSPEAVTAKAVAYFGEGGLGLRVTDQNAFCAYFAGGGGYVSVTTCLEGKKTVVDLETREWDYHVKQFMQEVG